MVKILVTVAATFACSFTGAFPSFATFAVAIAFFAFAGFLGPATTLCCFLFCHGDVLEIKILYYPNHRYRYSILRKILNARLFLLVDFSLKAL
jgi:hypothetical protein